jgi:formate transporter
VGALLALVSRSTVGKVVAMWLPILTFFAQGFEHSIVNMFVIPVGMMFGAPVSIGNWLLWNQLPVTLGNILAGVFLTGLALYSTYGERSVLSDDASASESDSDKAEALIPNAAVTQ